MNMHAGNSPAHYFDVTEPDGYRRTAGYTSSGWYFWDETEANVLGPYETYGQAEVAREQYRP